jgi:uncharacterized DUF497 family protein
VRDDDFEWDDQKSETNKAKHGIDFHEARNLWRSGVDEFPSPQGKEMRYVAFGRLRNRLYLVALSYRGHRRRIISAREATEEERNKHEAQKKSQGKGAG